MVRSLKGLAGSVYGQSRYSLDFATSGWEALHAITADGLTIMSGAEPRRWSTTTSMVLSVILDHLGRDIVWVAERRWAAWSRISASPSLHIAGPHDRRCRGKGSCQDVSPSDGAVHQQAMHAVGHVGKMRNRTAVILATTLVVVRKFHVCGLGFRARNCALCSAQISSFRKSQVAAASSSSASSVPFSM